MDSPNQYRSKPGISPESFGSVGSSPPNSAGASVDHSGSEVETLHRPKPGPVHLTAMTGASTGFRRKYIHMSMRSAPPGAAHGSSAFSHLEHKSSLQRMHTIRPTWSRMRSDFTLIYIIPILIGRCAPAAQGSTADYLLSGFKSHAQNS